MVTAETFGVLFEKFGATVFIIIVLIYFLVTLNEQHRAERNEWREDSNKNCDNFLESQKETTEVIRELTRVIERIK